MLANLLAQIQDLQDWVQKGDKDSVAMTATDITTPFHYSTTLFLLCSTLPIPSLPPPFCPDSLTLIYLGGSLLFLQANMRRSKLHPQGATACAAKVVFFMMTIRQLVLAEDPSNSTETQWDWAIKKWKHKRIIFILCFTVITIYTTSLAFWFL